MHLPYASPDPLSSTEFEDKVYGYVSFTVTANGLCALNGLFTNGTHQDTAYDVGVIAQFFDNSGETARITADLAKIPGTFGGNKEVWAIETMQIEPVIWSGIHTVRITWKFDLPATPPGFSVNISGPGFKDGGTYNIDEIDSYKNGLNRFIYRSEGSSWAVSSKYVLSKQAANDFAIAAVGKFGYGTGDEIFALAKDGRNRFFYREANGNWSNTAANPIGTVAINDFDMIAVGKFGFGSGDEIFALAKNGRNRVFYREANGNWSNTAADPIGAAAINEFDMIAVGKFGFGSGDEIFALAKDGRNRFFYREANGSWSNTAADAIGATAINEFDMIAVGKFGFGSGDEIFALAKDGRNRFFYREANGSWSNTAGNAIGATAINEFDMIAVGKFGFGSGDEIFALAKDGRNRFFYREANGNWANTSGDYLNRADVSEFSYAKAGKFGFGSSTDIFAYRLGT